MKLLSATFILAVVILMAVPIQAQTDYQVSAMNGTLTDDYNLEFDIYILRVGSTPIQLAGFQTSIYFNDVIRNGGTLTGTYLPGTSGLSSSETPNIPNLSFTSSGGSIHQFRIAPKIPTGAGNGTVISNTAPGTRFGRFRITNSVAFNKTTAVNWQWNFTTAAGEYSSYINAYLGTVNSNITDESKYQMSLPDPLQPASTFALSVSVLNGWNMVSVPGLHPVNQNVETWWQYKDPGAGVFRFQGGYQAVTTTVPGTGYWMKHSGARTYNTGDEWPEFQIVAHDPIAGAQGWNLFGGYEQVAATAGLTTTPAGLISGSVYKYSAGYQTTASLEPGYGYWVKLTGAGQIHIPSGSAGPFKLAETGTDDFGQIILTDNSFKSYTLYAADAEADLNRYELPPLPPEGMFDIRYSSGRYVENISSGIQTIDLSGVQYPVNIRCEEISIIIMDETGKEITRLKAGESFSLENYTSKLFITENVIPESYSLEQNYPNPFNPSTMIGFSLPEASNNVMVTIYNTLGQKVAELVNTQLEAGKYNYRWEAGSIASGIYIYELRTDKFVSAKKMMLLR